MTFTGLPNVLSTERLVFSVLTSRKAREGRPCSLEGCMFQAGEESGASMEHGRSIDTGHDVYKPCLCHTEGRNQDGSRKALYQVSAFSGELPGVPRRPPNALWGSKHILQNYVWPTNLHAFQGRLSLPLDSHAWYTGKGTVVGCGLHSSRVLVDFQPLCSLSSSSAEKGVLFPVGIYTAALAESRPQNHWLALPPTLDGYFLNASSPSH